MGILGLLVVFVILCFGFVLLFGPPYLPTLTKQMQIALELADLQPGQRLLELGCGDGKVLIAAAQRGVHVVGFELNPLLVIVCKARTWRYRQLVRVHWANFWTKEWPPTDVIFIFGLPRIMKHLDTKIVQECRKPVKLVSFAFAIPRRKVTKKQGGVLRYDYK
ncbi:MAG TPA: class I SAM-dependent methyltransferase [Candidatus Microsaccharimonas sp.]|nr:class I SAM-dependent methyltransferase [Candidatus Microsaccharimonas sp.]